LLPQATRRDRSSSLADGSDPAVYRDAAAQGVATPTASRSSQPLADSSSTTLIRGRRSTPSSSNSPLIERGVVRIATVTLVEVGYSARNAAELRAGCADPPIASMPVEYATPVSEDRAVQRLNILAERGTHRAPSIPDLLIAAIAESAGLVVLHAVKDFDLIVEVTGQPTERLRR
jgi:predicted nucleic acid-binding protein